jgi:ribosomal 50S subunit-associated protein YjgA (DUF615 family)
MAGPRPEIPGSLVQHAAACFAGTSFDVSRERVLQDLLAWAALGSAVDAQGIANRAREGQELVRGALAHAVSVRRGLADQLDQHSGALQQEVASIGRLHNLRAVLLEQGEVALKRDFDHSHRQQIAQLCQVSDRGRKCGR